MVVIGKAAQQLRQALQPQAGVKRISKGKIVGNIGGQDVEQQHPPKNKRRRNRKDAPPPGETFGLGHGGLLHKSGLGQGFPSRQGTPA